MSDRVEILQKLTKLLWGILLFILLSVILSGTSPIEFRDVDIKYEYDSTLFIATPFIVFLLVILDYLKHQKERIFMINFMLGIPLSFFSFVLVLLLSYSIDFSRDNENILFQNRFDTQQRIVYRTTYSNEGGSAHRLKTLNKYFQWRQKLDTTEINPIKWINVKKQSKH